MTPRRATQIRIAALGFCAACSQALLVRETLSVIAGTELLLGILIASWLFWTGAGGMLGGRLKDRGAERAGSLLPPLAVLTAILVPVTVILIRTARAAGGWPPGATVPFVSAAAFCLAVPAPFALVYGIFYNAASMTAVPGTVRRGITAAYALEAGGSAAGAVLFPLVISAVFTQVGSAVAVALTVGVTLAATAGTRRAARLVAAGAAVAAALAATPALDRSTMSLVFPGFSIDRIVPSRHGELTAVRDRESVSIFAGSTRIATLPPTGLEEEAVHVPLLAHPRPRAVLLVGSAVGGGFEEAARHPGVERVDWVEIDPSLSSLARSLVGRDTLSADGSSGPQVRGIEGDGRWYLARRGGSFDVIIVSVPAPTTLRWNRFFTEEFFRTAGSSLAPGGILAISHPSSEDFLSSDLVEALSMIDRTLRKVYRHVRTVPGVTARILASDEPIEIGEIPGRLETRRLRTRYLRSGELALSCSPSRTGHVEDALSRARTTEVNTDARPLLVMLELVLEGTRAGGAAVPRLLASIPAHLPPAAGLALLAAALLAARRRAAERAAVFTVGMSAMLLQVTVMLTFQSYSGLLYQAFIVMTSLFMAGAAIGASRGPGNAPPRTALRASHAGLIACAAAVPAWLRVAASGSTGPAVGIAGFLAVPALSGLLTGTYYRTVVHAAYGKRGGEGPAVYYAWDLFGAVAGALIGGILLVPVAGIGGTIAFIAGSHVLAAILLAGRVPG